MKLVVISKMQQLLTLLFLTVALLITEDSRFFDKNEK